MPSSRPRISFNESGFCNGCVYNSEKRLEIDWADRKESLRSILGSSRVKDINPNYDCVVAWSGGKDSSAVALKLREELDLNPLLVTFSPLIPTPEGDFNRRSLLRKGFDSVFLAPSLKTSSYLSKRFLIERGDPKVHWNAGINAVTINIASALRIPIVFYAEHGESEYGGKVIGAESSLRRNLDEILENQIGDDPINWIDETLTERELEPYLIDGPKLESLDVLYFAHFFPWDVVQNLEYVETAIEFRRNPRGRTYGTFTDFDSLDDTMDDLYYYMQFVKFGFGRCLRDCARQIQKGRMTREEAFRLIDDFDGEYPIESIPPTLEFLEMSQIELENIIDGHRRKDLWEKNGEEWDLKHSLSESEI
jgi:N-acetyl sugar amidotransferase